MARQNHPRSPKRPNELSESLRASPIHSGPGTDTSNRERKSEIREISNRSKPSEVYLIQRDNKKLREDWDTISFTPKDGARVDAKPNNAIVVELQIVHRNVRRIMIDNGSLADILHLSVFDQLGFQRKDLDPFNTHLLAFGRTKNSNAPCQNWNQTLPKNRITRICGDRPTQLALQCAAEKAFP
ncbi:hypothetical protein ACOSQ3_018927 [Xanthoceras sorbifolium]